MFAGIKKINLGDSFNLLTNYFSPKIIGEVNEVFIKIALIKGEDIPWHNHREEDELFLVVDGTLLLELQGQENITLQAGDMLIVPRGVNHRVSSKEVCKIMLVEQNTTAHTGDIETAITKSIEQQK